MNVRIMVTHPIATERGPECWDGKVHAFTSSLTDVDAVKRFLRPFILDRYQRWSRDSRVIDGRAVLFPNRYTTGVHSVWLECAE